MLFHRAVEAQQKLELAVKNHEQDRQTLAAKLKKVTLMLL